MNRNDNRFGTVKVVEKIGVSFERLRYWEQRGVVEPMYVQCGTRKYRRYSHEDMKRALFIKMLVDDEKYSLEGALRKLETKKNEQGERLSYD